MEKYNKKWYAAQWCRVILKVQSINSVEEEDFDLITSDEKRIWIAKDVASFIHRLWPEGKYFVDEESLILYIQDGMERMISVCSYAFLRAKEPRKAFLDELLGQIKLERWPDLYHLL